MLISSYSINMIVHNNLILASSSKSRYNILKKTGLSFIQVHPTCNEEKIKKTICTKNIKPANFAKKLSFEKSKSVSNQEKYNKHYVIGCDTIIYLSNNKIFDKAKNINEAKIKIKKLSGKTHKIVSGLTICVAGKKIWQCSATTDVKIRNLSEKQISTYLNMTGRQILSSVGCYQIESMGPNIIENISGDFFNVMGFPLFKFLNYISRGK